MIPATPALTLADEPVRTAICNALIRDGLIAHAMAWLGQHLGLPRAARRDAAEEAVQETASRAVQNGASFDSSRGALVAWLHGILGHVLSRMYRESRRRPAQPDSDPAAWEAVADVLASTDSDAVADRMDIETILGRLDDQQRLLIHLRYREGMSFTEIAQRLNISAEAARVRLSRALNAARLAAGVRRQESPR